MKGWKSIVIELFCNQHLVKRMTHAAEGERERERENNAGRRERQEKDKYIVTADLVADCVFKCLRALHQNLTILTLN